MHKQNDQRGGGQGPETPTRSGSNRTTEAYPTEALVQAPSKGIGVLAPTTAEDHVTERTAIHRAALRAMENDPWRFLAGEADAEDVDRVLAILDGLERGCS